MIINDDDIKINIIYKDNLYSNLKFDDVEELFSDYKNRQKNLKPKEMIRIDDSIAVFSNDRDENKFYPHIYNTSTGEEKWVLLMATDDEGYALYKNPVTGKMQMAWYNKNLEKPLTDDEEKKLITCYNPKA